MAQILVVNEDNCWYQGIATLENYYEIDLERKIHKHAADAFSGYYTIKGKYTFGNKNKETSDGDLLLISKDFSKWVILEVEMVKKSLDHTRKQMRVFTDPHFDIEDLVSYCVGQEPTLGAVEVELFKLFADPPEVLVVFDSYHPTKLDNLKNEFKSINICVFEVYKTNIHDFETYRLSGDYPYIISGYTYLKPSSGFNTYHIERPDIMQGVQPGDLDIYYKMKTVRSKLIDADGDLYLYIPGNPFTAGKRCTLSKTSEGRYIIDALN